jgi:hypothetical protein
MPRTIEEIDRAITVCAAELRACQKQEVSSLEDSLKKINDLLRLSSELEQHKRDLYQMF